MYIAILGRQPALGIAELEHLYGGDDVRWFSDVSAIIKASDFSINSLGGAQKAGRVVAELPRADWRQASMKAVQAYSKAWSDTDHKITLGISAYGFDVSARDVQKTGLVLKQKLKQSGVSLRLIPNTEAIISSATSHHNKLGLSDNKVELIIVRARNGRVIIAESIGSQNITAYARRDQERPKRDAFVGMLPPKLAQIMINLAVSKELASVHPRILDPFCGTGVVLQEAALMHFPVYGTDINEKMIRYSRDNLNWLQESHRISFDWYLHEGDAMTTSWQQPVDAVVCEGYLGQPFSAPPSPAKLEEVRKNCNHIMSSFLKNIANQITPGTPLCVGVPAWRDHNGTFTHLPLVRQLAELGYTQVKFTTVKPDELLYFREDQIVARELLVLIRK
jgi:tRNA G10  N-methylase Trm11